MRYVDSHTTKKISKIGLGTWQFGSRDWGYGSEYERWIGAIVRRALDSGITLFDTAEVYAWGRGERLLGAALGDASASAFVATKILPVLPLSPVVQQRAVASAARLHVQRLDLYQVHQPNPMIRDRATMAGMRALQDVGLIENVGVSNYSLARWRAAEAALGRPVLTNQVQYSLAHREPEEHLLPYAANHRRLVIAYSPLAQGFLSGRYTVDHPPSSPIQRFNPLFLPVNLARGAVLQSRVREIADAHDVTSAQIALAYVIHRPEVVAIPGASSVEQVEANAAAAEIELTDDEYFALSDAARQFRPETGLRTLPRRIAATR
jgi:aryl-alcohol dehydrogenase-like predicted oxidoreductase